MAVSRRTSTAIWATMVIGATPAGAYRSSQVAISVPPRPLSEAIREIGRQSGADIRFDPDVVRGVTSAPVINAHSVEQALRRAIRGRSLSVTHKRDGTFLVTNDILVVARRDEAETSLLVREASTSDRSGQSLREQARNTQVLSSRLIREQQDLTLADVLRNAGGVSVNAATTQGGVAYSIRGFGSNGLVNGLPGGSTNGVQAGATASVANIERVEVLKGPDAILAGSDNLGGAINVVLKKPDATPHLEATVDTGSFGLRRFTGDANEAISADRTLSARIIAVASDMNHNFGGYTGDREWLFAPSIRFKNAHTDIIVSASTGSQTFGLTPNVPTDPATNRLFDLPRGTPLLGRNQNTRIATTQFNLDARQDVTDWLLLVLRAQHQKITLDANSYTPFAVIDDAGDLLASNGTSAQRGNSDTVDGYARATLSTFGVRHRITIGGTYLHTDTSNYTASTASTFVYNLITPDDGALPPLAPTDSFSYRLKASQTGIYAQDLIEFWKFHLSAAVRHNAYRTIGNDAFSVSPPQKDSSTLPSFGAVLDVLPTLSLFGNYVEGYSPNFSLDFNGNRLPNIRSRNIEAGAKLDLFNKRLVINASWFNLRQSNLVVTDPIHPGFSIPVPGQEGTGIDINASGEIVRGWTVQASLTRTKYRYLTYSEYGNVVVAQPRDQYSVYSTYRHRIGEGKTAGISAGLYGRSRASTDFFGTYYVPPSRQVDINGLLTIGRLDVNLGVRNVFDRRNYGITYSPAFVPYAEPRTWRLSATYHFI